MLLGNEEFQNQAIQKKLYKIKQVFKNIIIEDNIFFIWKRDSCFSKLFLVEKGSLDFLALKI